MAEYTLPSGRASIETEGGPMSEINYRYPVAGKDKTIQELLVECLQAHEFIKHDYISMVNHNNKMTALKAEIERLKRYECSWTDCGAQKKNKELQAKVGEKDRRIAKALNILSDEVKTVEAPTYLWNAIYALREMRHD